MSGLAHSLPPWLGWPALAAGLLLLAAGLALLGLGRRGRRVGDHPHCRRCGHDLHGLPPTSARCPECGHPTADAPTGRRIPRRGPLWSGLAALLLALPLLGAWGWGQYRTFDWYAWKPTAWLIRDARAHARTAGPVPEWDLYELLNRLADGSLSDGQLEQFKSAALEVQEDDALPWRWSFRRWRHALGDLIRAGHFTDAEWDRAIAQSFAAEIEVRPVVRRGRMTPMSLEVEDRSPEGMQFVTTGVSDPLTLGGVPLPADPRRGAFERLRMLDGDVDRLYGSGKSGGATLRLGPLPELPDGPTQLEVVYPFHVRAFMDGKRAFRPTTAEIRVSTPVELVASDAIVDNFMSNAELDAEVRSAVQDVRIENAPQGDYVVVWLRFDDAPIDLAVNIVVEHGGRDLDVGRVIRRASEPSGWRTYWFRSPRSLRGQASVVLTPDQAAAEEDWNDHSLGTFYGDRIVLGPVEIDAPYQHRANFDLTLATAFETELRLHDVQPHGRRRYGRDPHMRQASLRSSGELPAPIHHRVVIRQGGEELISDEMAVLDSHYRTDGLFQFEIPEAGAFDLWLLPDAAWEAGATDEDRPPWGYPLVFEDVEVGGGPYTPRAVLDGSGPATE